MNTGEASIGSVHHLTLPENVGLEAAFMLHLTRAVSMAPPWRSSNALR
jgi:hypothetical protein